MSTPQTPGTATSQRPAGLHASLLAWLAGAASSVAWIIVRVLDLEQLADRAALLARTDPVRGMSDALAAEIVLKWGFIFLGLWAVTTAAFLLVAFLMWAGRAWARSTLAVLTVLVVLLVLNANHPLAFAAAGCAVLGCALSYLPKPSAYLSRVS